MPDPTPPVIPSVKEVFNALMARIEPELTTDQVPLLMEKYKDETEEQKKTRMERYHQAYIAYEKALVEYVEHINKQVDQYRRLAFASAEEKTRAQEDDRIAELETTFAS